MLFILGMQYLYLGVLRLVLGLGMRLAYSSTKSALFMWPILANQNILRSAYLEYSHTHIVQNHFAKLPFVLGRFLYSIVDIWRIS